MSKIIAVNAGSSSLKFQLFEMPEEKVLVQGLIERIGMQDAVVTLKYDGQKKSKTLPILNHAVAVEILLNSLVEENGVETSPFGWNALALSDEYVRFLSQMLSKLNEFLIEKGCNDRCYFHISESPFFA